MIEQAGPARHTRDFLGGEVAAEIDFLNSADDLTSAIRDIERLTAAGRLPYWGHNRLAGLRHRLDQILKSTGFAESDVVGAL